MKIKNLKYLHDLCLRDFSFRRTESFITIDSTGSWTYSYRIPLNPFRKLHNQYFCIEFFLLPGYSNHYEECFSMFIKKIENPIFYNRMLNSHIHGFSGSHDKRFNKIGVK